MKNSILYLLLNKTILIIMNADILCSIPSPNSRNAYLCRAPLYFSAPQPRYIFRMVGTVSSQNVRSRTSTGRTDQQQARLTTGSLLVVVHATRAPTVHRLRLYTVSYRSDPFAVSIHTGPKNTGLSPESQYCRATANLSK
jgi:hypothetical protein